MLGILTLIVAAMVNSSNINFRIAGNQQYRSEALLTAQNAIEEYISNEANFTIPLPTAAISIPRTWMAMAWMSFPPSWSRRSACAPFPSS
ncbi:hypothetical protein ACE0DR_21875 [Azotobacter sp. CWF10]